MKKDQEKKQPDEVSRRGFLVGTGTVVVGGVIGAGLLSSCNDGGEVTKTIVQTTTKTVPTTITTTIGDGQTVTVTSSVGAGATVTETKTITSTGTGGEVEPAFEEETSVVTDLDVNTAGDVCSVDVKNGKIIRIRPLRWTDKYTEDEIADSKWQCEAKGITFIGKLKKSTPGYQYYPYKKRVYHPNRVKYPLLRVDWNPDADPKTGRNTQNRGKSKYKRISWDEATSIIAKEIKRVHETYGSFGCMSIGEDGHHEAKTIHGAGGCQARLLRDAGAGNYTQEMRNPDSWEGWYWGAKHVWGNLAVGLPKPYPNLWETAQNCEMVVWEGNDWESTWAGCHGEIYSRCLYYWEDLGIKQIYITPDCNYSACVHADKWIPVLPNTDAALQIAIAYTWITEDTYEHDYMDTHCIGFDADHMPDNSNPEDNVKDYILGTYDGVPKTPAWASEKCGVPEWTIKALARQWSSLKTSTGGSAGNQMRGPYGTETTRYEALLLAMQGMGKPGVAKAGLGNPSTKKAVSVASATRAITGATKQLIPRTQTHHAILDGHCESWGNTAIASDVSDQFTKYTYPIDAADGGTKVHLLWTEKPCNTACWNDGFLFIEAIRSPEVEFYIANHQWFENDCRFADLVMPVCTKLEQTDISAGGGMSGQTTLTIQKAAIDFIGESRSDYDIGCAVAQKLEEYGGQYEGLYNKYTGGKSVEEWLHFAYENSGCTEEITWEELNEKQYYCPPVNLEKWSGNGFCLTKFYNDPSANPIGTPSGLLEFYSERLATNFPDDNERPPYPQWIEGGPTSEGWTHDERVNGERANEYPLLLVSNHPRWRNHVQLDNLPWLREIPTMKIKGYDGYMYEPIWINPIDAEARGIKHGDIVKLYNQRGIVLGAAYVTGRIKVGALSQDHGAGVDLITDKIDRGGSNNLISPEGPLSKNCWGQATTSFLVEIEKLKPEEMEEWRNTYPEAFTRSYDPAYGVLPNSWIDGGSW